MWVFTETGFVSAVRKVDSPSKITARSRDRQSLEVLAELSETEILETPFADYGYRVLVSDDIYKVWLTTLLTCSTMTILKTVLGRLVATFSTTPLARYGKKCSQWPIRRLLELFHHTVALINHPGNALR